MVPESSGINRVDDAFMRVNRGEEVSVTPRAEAGGANKQRIIVNIDKQTIFDVINAGIRSGDIYISTANIAGVVA